MASLVNNNGSWSLVFTRSGRQKRVSLHLAATNETRKTATILKKKLEADFAMGLYDPWAESSELKPVSWSEAVTLFLREKKPITGRSGLDVYRYALKSFNEHANPARPDSVKPKQIQKWYHETDLAAATVTNYLNHLRMFFKWCKDNRYTDSDPSEGLKLKRHKQPDPEHFTMAMIDVLIGRMNAWYESGGRETIHSGSDRYYLVDVVRFAVMSGCRLNEITGLRWPDVDFVGKTVHIRLPKNGQDRYQAMFPAMETLLRSLISAGDYVFTLNGSRLDGSRLSKRFKYFVRECGFSERLHFHSLRHTTGYFLANNGVNQKMIQSHLGHLDGRMTNRYTKVDLDGMRKEIGRLFSGDSAV